VAPHHLQTLPRGGADPLAKYAYGAALAEARGRTLSLVAPVSERNLNRQPHPLMSPLVWDLGHIAAFEDLWLCRSAGDLEILRPELSEVYDATETPRAGRGDVPYLRREEALEFMQQVHERALLLLERADISADGDRLNAGGFVWEMLIGHEQQHNETMLQTLQLVGPDVYSPTRRPLPPAPPKRRPDTVEVPGGPFLMGDPGLEFAYDNERPRHEVHVDAFRIDRTPVTNAAFLEFVADGGYARRDLWDPAGWGWRTSEGVQRPLFWSADGHERRFERIGPIEPDMPVMHVSWFEADAFARWRGARLPTEEEWEKAAAWDPDAGESRRRPWGDADPTPQLANLGQVSFGPAPAGALPAGVSACGALGMVGDAWEWTASSFTGYEGFAAFPYPQYSEAFFGGDFRVLRGGSWATGPSIARNTFRNWDHPQRRQIFAGLRCAEDR
jgi:iron(II)-dependent oxidoreductase